MTEGEEGIPVTLSIEVEGFATPQIDSTAKFHSDFTEINHGTEWGSNPAVALLCAPISGEGEPFVLVGVIEADTGEEEVKPYHLAGPAAQEMVKDLQGSEHLAGYHIQAVSFYGEAWMYQIPVETPEDQLYNAAKTAPRKEIKTVITVDVATGIHQISVLTRGDDAFEEATDNNSEALAAIQAVAEQLQDVSF